MKITIFVLLLILISVAADASGLLSGASLCINTDGVVIRDVKRNGKLWEAGIRLGDIILQIDGQAITTLDKYVQKSKSTNNKTATMLFSSNGKEYTIVKKGDSYHRENTVATRPPQNNIAVIKSPATDEDFIEGDDKAQANSQTSNVVDTSAAKTTENTELTTTETYERLSKIRKNVLRNSKDLSIGEIDQDNSKTAPSVSRSLFAEQLIDNNGNARLMRAAKFAAFLFSEYGKGDRIITKLARTPGYEHEFVGFRGIEWGTHISQIGDMELLPLSDSEDIDNRFGTRQDDERKIDFPLEINSRYIGHFFLFGTPIYHFYKDRLIEVVLLIETMQEYDKLPYCFTDIFGLPSYTVSGGEQIWDGNVTDINIKFGRSELMSKTMHSYHMVLTANNDPR